MNKSSNIHKPYVYKVQVCWFLTQRPLEAQGLRRNVFIILLYVDIFHSFNIFRPRRMLCCFFSFRRVILGVFLSFHIIVFILLLINFD